MESNLQGQSFGSQVVSRCSLLCCPRTPCTGFISRELEVGPLLLWLPDPETSGSGTVVEVIGIHVGWGLYATETTGKIFCSSCPWCVLCMCRLCMCVVYVCTVCVVCVCVAGLYRLAKTPGPEPTALALGLDSFPGSLRFSLFSCLFIMSCDSPRSACPQLQITVKIRIIIGKYWIGELDAILYFDKIILFLNNFKIMIFFKKSTVFCCLENTLDCMESHQGLHPDRPAWNPELLTPCREAANAK